MTMLYKDFLRQLAGCPFCAKSNRMLKENGSACLTYALAPYHPHHLLVLPKRHMESMLDLNDGEKEDIEELQQLGLKALRAMGYKSVTLVLREGDLSETKSVAHLHHHLIPQSRIGDLDHTGEERRILTDEEVEKTIQDLSSYL